MDYKPKYLNKAKQPPIELTDLQKLSSPSIEALISLTQHPGFAVLVGGLFPKKKADLYEAQFKNLPYSEFLHGSLVGQVDFMKWLSELAIHLEGAKKVQKEAAKQ